METFCSSAISVGVNVQVIRLLELINEPLTLLTVVLLTLGTVGFKFALVGVKDVVVVVPLLTVIRLMMLRRNLRS